MRLQQQRDFSAKIECIKWPKMSLFALNSAQMVQEEASGKAGAVTEGGDLGRKGARRGTARTWRRVCPGNFTARARDGHLE